MPETMVYSLYEMCGYLGCKHFIEPNVETHPDECDNSFPSHDFPSICGNCGYVLVSEYIHLDDGEKQHDHDAIPSGIVHTLTEWGRIWPELFRKYPDGKVGPNSSQFEV